MSMGGGGGSGSTTSGTFTPPLWTVNQFPDVVQAATDLYSQPQQQWQGQQIAGINDTQALGMQALANQFGNVAPDMAAARRNAQLTASGAYENPYASVQTLVADNPYMGNSVSSALDARYGNYNPTTTDAASNQYAGFGPMYQDFKQNAMNDIVRNYQNAIAPGTASAFNTSNAFHSGAHEAQVGMDTYNLANSLGRTGNALDQGQWQYSGNLQQGLSQMNQQAQLADEARNLQGQQGMQNLWTNTALADQARNAGLAGQQIQLGVNAQQGDLQRASDAWNAERNRQMGAFDQALQGSQFDQNNARGLIGLGDIQRGYTQDLLNQSQQNWQGQMNYPSQMIQSYLSALAQASGNYGQSVTTQYGPQYQANPFANAVGLGLIGASAYNGWGG